MFFSLTIFGQNKQLSILFQDSIQAQKWIKKLNYKQTFTTELERDEELQRVFFLLRERGFLTANVDSSKLDSLRAVYYISLGDVYKWAALKKGNVDDEVLSAVGFSEKFYFDHLFTPLEVALLMEKMVVYEENNGYPFSAIKLDSVKIEATKISATLQLTKNQLCLIDSFLVGGNAKISTYYVQRLIGIKKGDKYNEQRVMQISKRVREVPFLSERKAAEVYFSEKYTKLILHLNEKKANRFDGVLGFLPNETTGKLLITGQLTLKLCNSFNKGEIVDVDWQKLQAKTQNLKARVQIPFLFRSPFGTDMSFKLYKRDTLFTDVSENIGLSYQLGISNFFKVFFTNRSIALISTRGLENLTTLPQFVDVNSKAYGIGFRTEHVDYKLNPRKGFIIEGSGSVGTKEIKKNLKLKQEAYDKISPLKNNIYTLDFSAEYFIPIKKRSTLVFGNKSALIESKNLFANEIFRIGGLSTLRGFDEESILASAYTISKLEYRFLLDLNSYLFLFANHAYYQNKTSRDLNNATKWVSDNPYGFGVGITFETKPGIFSLSYALGKQFSNPISIRAAKIHFGIVSTF